MGYAPNVFDPPPWTSSALRPDGVFGGRFDDPSGSWEKPLPESQRFRIIYCATEGVAAFAECCDHFCPDVDILINEELVEADTLKNQTVGGIIRSGWWQKRLVGEATLDPSLRFADLETLQTLVALRLSPRIMQVMRGFGLSRLDRGALTGQHRRLTQEIARFIYGLKNRKGESLFHGIRYHSTLNHRWECWAIFDTRVRQLDPAGGHQMIVRSSQNITPDHSNLLHAAKHLRLGIEINSTTIIFPC